MYAIASTEGVGGDGGTGSGSDKADTAMAAPSTIVTKNDANGRREN